MPQTYGQFLDQRIRDDYSDDLPGATFRFQQDAPSSSRPRFFGAFVLLILGLAASLLVHGVRLAPAQHVVRQGDTLFKLAAQYYGDGHVYQEIAKANSLKPPFVIRPGMRLQIPNVATHYDFISLLLATAVIVFFMFLVDIPAFSAARKILDPAAPPNAPAVAFTAAVFTLATFLWIIAIWGIVGSKGLIAAAPVVLFFVAVFRARALAPAFDNSPFKATVAWSIASLLTGSAILFVILAGTALAGEQIRAALKTLSFLAPR